ncbi:CoA transferase [Micromonospora sp. ANENR4]|uniref:CaiB/BaiF CoA transferase family protein n=1 Tax=unclassified Micromonospora TaxID=2617518 RepID=UPI00188F7A77|nr:MULTISPECIES: CoA transferase [unclassified Micromonospora]MBF5028791.1 CoA transferase [Micromonospora sp. ANENR4]MCZ7476080.1 CoA transferase [Micromonospora sp. WMMC273]
MTGGFPDGPLTGVRVVEAGVLLAGPFCAQLLGDFGAEVIKVEQPDGGDPMRQWGREKPHGKSLWFPVVARNKKSVTCNLRVPEGQQLMRDLLADADVFVENFRPGTLERWGLAPEELHRINPRLVVVRVTAFGQDGPYASRAGYGSIGEAMGGIRHVTGDPSTPPSRIGVSLGDSLAGTFAALGAMMALRVAGSTGQGQVVDSAIYESVLALMESLVPEYALTGYVRERTGSILPNVAPSNAYPTRDGATVLIAANQDTVFRRLAAVMGRPDLADDPRYATHAARGAHQAELDDLIAAWTVTFEPAALLRLLHLGGVPAGSVYTAREMLADEHFAAREAIVELDHPEMGAFPMQNVAPRLSRTPGRLRSVGPRLGEHTDEVLRQVLRLADDRITELRAAGAI